MSNTTTPTRPGRGIPVPGIDTRGAAEQKAQSLSFSGWPLTPPQSANESRRPSLAYSALSDASNSGPSSIAGYSQPATPVHSMHSSADNFAHQWSDGTQMHADIAGVNNNGCALGQMQPVFSAAFHQQAMCGTTGVENANTYSPHGQGHDNNAFGIQMETASPMRNDDWQNTQHAQLGMNMHSGLKTTLFQSGLGQDQNSSSMYAQPSSSIPSLQQSAFPNYESSAPPAPTTMYANPQVVVPSHLSPQDIYPVEQYLGYEQDEKMGQDFSQSFDSTSSGYGWESVEPQSPEEAYFGNSDGEDYVMIKDDYSGTPSRNASFRGHRIMNGPSPSRVRRRTSRKTRKSHATGKVRFEDYTGNCRVRCEGEPFMFMDGRPVPVSSREAKPHKCTHKDAKGNICNGSFERSEHLKRHMSSHSDERPYRCPLPDCEKAMSRPDNASDHIMSHLWIDPNSKGKRNKRCTWEQVESGILKTYEPKPAAKMLTGLRKRYMEAIEKKSNKVRGRGQ